MQVAWEQTDKHTDGRTDGAHSQHC